jgi:hypothetical protein
LYRYAAVLLLACGCLLGCKRLDDTLAPGAVDSIVGILPAVVWWGCTRAQVSLPIAPESAGFQPLVEPVE